jgi:hypothetical protein
MSTLRQLTRSRLDEQAGLVRLEVLGEQEGQAGAGGHLGEQVLEGLLAAGRGADADDQGGG